MYTFTADGLRGVDRTSRTPPLATGLESKLQFMHVNRLLALHTKTYKNQLPAFDQDYYRN